MSSHAVPSCGYAILELKEVATTQAQKSSKAFTAASAAQQLGDQSLIKAANFTLQQVTTSAANNTKVALANAGVACKKSDPCFSALSALKDAAALQGQKSSQAFTAMSTAQQLGDKTLVDAATASIQQVTVSGADNTKAAMTAAAESCLL